MTADKTEKIQISIKVPKSILEEIDQLCKTNYISRTSWFVSAARNTLKHQRTSKMEKILSKIKEMEE